MIDDEKEETLSMCLEDTASAHEKRSVNYSRLTVPVESPRT